MGRPVHILFFALLLVLINVSGLFAGTEHASLKFPLFTLGLGQPDIDLFTGLKKSSGTGSLFADSVLKDRVMALQPGSDPLEEYLKRPQFLTLDERTKQLCWQNILRLMQNKTFCGKYNVRDKDDAAFYTGLYYSRFWTSAAFFGKENGDFLFQPGPAGMGFNMPYETVYNAEQVFKLYLTQYPRGKYVLAALFNIARCRVRQKDFNEAYYAYKYAMRIALKDLFPDDQGMADRIALDMVRYNKKYGEDLSIQLQVQNQPGLKKERNLEITMERKLLRIKVQKRL
jgi:hypothetical protein